MRMTYNILVAEPSDALWASIANGLRRPQPDAAIVRVKDGEQALRFLFQRGLLADAPETPNLIVLAAELPVLPADTVIARLRQHPRTLAIPVIIVSPQGDQDALDHEPDVVVITNTLRLEKEVANAASRLSELP